MRNAVQHGALACVDCSIALLAALCKDALRLLDRTSMATLITTECAPRHMAPEAKLLRQRLVCTLAESL